MKKTKRLYKHIASFSQVGDIKALRGKSADEIVAYFNAGKGKPTIDEDPDPDDVRSPDDGTYAPQELFDGTVKTTSDKQWIVEDNAAGWEKWPELFADNEDGDDAQVYIDLFQLYDTPEVKKYKVTLYYHTNVTVEVEAINRKEAIETAREGVCADEYVKPILEGLVEDDSPDCETIEKEN